MPSPRPSPIRWERVSEGRVRVRPIRKLLLRITLNVMERWKGVVMSEANTPDWKRDFPVRQTAEHEVSRRQFIKVACCSALAVGAAGLVKGKLLALPPATEPKLVSQVNEIPVGGYKLFRYPTENHPCILVRL